MGFKVTRSGGAYARKLRACQVLYVFTEGSMVFTKRWVLYNFYVISGGVTDEGDVT